MNVQDKGQDKLVAKLPKNIGWSMGTELRESHYVLSAKNSAPVQRGMIFHVTLGTLLPCVVQNPTRVFKHLYHPVLDGMQAVASHVGRMD